MLYDRDAPPDYAAVEYISPAGLRKLGWTTAWIQQRLGEPDRTAKNPIYATAAPTRLYDVVRVAEAEAQLPDTPRAARVKSLAQAAKIITERRHQERIEAERANCVLDQVAKGDKTIREAAAELGVSPAVMRSRMHQAGKSWPARDARAAANNAPEAVELREIIAFETAYAQAVAAEQNQCQGITDKGNYCTNHSIKGASYCGWHHPEIPPNICAGQSRQGNPCQKLAKVNGYCDHCMRRMTRRNQRRPAKETAPKPGKTNHHRREVDP